MIKSVNVNLLIFWIEWNKKNVEFNDEKFYCNLNKYGKLWFCICRLSTCLKKHQYEEKGDRERVEKEGKKRTFWNLRRER